MDENRIADRGRFWRRWATSTIARNGKMLSTGSLTINPTLISGNSGNINLAQSGSDSIISGNSGTITIKLRQLDAGGLKLRGNSGPVKLYRQAAIRMITCFLI